MEEGEAKKENGRERVCFALLVPDGVSKVLILSNGIEGGFLMCLFRSNCSREREVL